MDSSHDVSHSFTDLMTSLAVIFILLLVATLNQHLKGSKDDIESVRKEVQKRLAGKNLELVQDPNDPFTQIIKIDEEKLKFREGSSNLEGAGAILVRDLAAILSESLCSDELEDKIESVIFEGHTSNTGDVSIEGKLSNVKLSQDRAYVVLYEAFTTIDNGEASVECLRKKSSATGRGSSRPIIHDLEKKDQNRRVEIKIRIKPPKYITESLGESSK